MRVNGVNTQTLQDICSLISNPERMLNIACYNTETEHVVSGHSLAIGRLRDTLWQRGIKTEELPLEFGLNSSAMDPVIQQFAMYLQKIDFTALSAPIICCIDGKTLTSYTEIKTRALCHLHSPVMWPLVMDAFAEYDVIIEVGPGTALSPMVKSKYPDKLVMSVNKRSDIDELKRALHMPISSQPAEV